MPTCIKIRKKKQQVCIGDLIDRVTLQTRALTAPTGGSAFYTLDFTGTEIWAMIETREGTDLFDGVDEQRLITHNVYVNFDSAITAESWLLMESTERLDILQVVNLDQRSLFMKLVCTDRGVEAHAGSGA